MNNFIKDIKKLEAELNDRLYSQIFLLTLEYKTTNDFNRYFKKDMFMKNNKAACHHVLHFLLNVLDPIVFKQKVCWPILDIKMEVQFLADVIKYVNELRITHEDSGLPILAKSHLQSAGGYKFLQFMNSLTQFILYEILKRSDTDEDTTLLRTIESGTDASKCNEEIKMLETIVNDQYITIAKEQAEFNDNYNIVKKIADDLLVDKTECERMLLEVQYQQNSIEEQTEQDMKALGDDAQPYNAINLKAKQKLKLLKMKEKVFQSCVELIEVLHMNQNSMKYDVTTLKYANVNLLHFLESFYNTLKANKHITSYGKKYDFTEELETVNEALEHLNKTLCTYEKLHSEILDFQEHLNKMSTNFKYNDKLDNTSALMNNIKKINSKPNFIKIDKFKI